MASEIILKRSAVPGKVPTTLDINLGEVAINTYDGVVYIKKNDTVIDTIVKILSEQDIDTDSTFTSNSDQLVPSQKAVKTALDLKQNELVSGTNIKTVNNLAITGSGNITVSLPHKSGIVSNTSFSGNPKKSTITFSTAFSDANYSIAIIGIDSRSWRVETVTNAGFIINAGANQALTGNVYWIAIKNGEV